MTAWGTKLRVSHFERVLGVYIWIEATTDRQYQAVLEKLEKILEIFRGVKDKLTLALRIAVANIFLTSLFSYQNRYLLCHRA